MVWHGYELPGLRAFRPLTLTLWGASVSLTLVHRWLSELRVRTGWTAVRAMATEWTVASLAALALLAGSYGLCALLVFVLEVWVGVRLLLGTARGERMIRGLLAQPARFIAVSFLGVITLGTVLLTLPRATVDGQGATALDAVFTATSATCVTGLVVVDTGSHFTGFGQAVIIGMVQVGGLGIMTLSAAVLLLLGVRLGLRSEAFMREVHQESSRRDLEHSVRFIFHSTLLLEAAGAVLLYWRLRPGAASSGEAAAQAVFTAISAYCNAGFALWSDSVTGLRHDGIVMAVLMVLITLGGLGFPVLRSVWRARFVGLDPAVAWRRLPVHTRIVLQITAGLTLGGAIALYWVDFHHAFAGLERGERLVAALFQSVTLRTAGFNTVDFADVSRVGVVLLLLLMFVGGSSGSTAGGVKTSTVAVVVLSVRSMLRGRDEAVVSGATIPRRVVFKAVGILTIFCGIYLVGLVALLLAEPGTEFLALCVEAMSALATVGISTGITPDLSPAGKVVIIVLMFVGRIGPLTLALAVGETRDAPRVTYPPGRFMVG